MEGTRMGFLLILMTFGLPGGHTRAHHKVHNLALYPERHSWCQATPIRQEVPTHADPECQPATIDNLVCLGACFSYSVPRAEDEVAIPPYCDACRPTVTEWVKITLNCTRKVTGEHYEIRKNVEKIHNCSCVDCSDNSPRRKVDYTEEEEDHESGEVFHRDPPIRFVPMEDNEIKEHPDENAEKEDDYDAEDAEDELEDYHHHPVDTLHTLKSDSASKELKFRNDEVEMILKNRIPEDDDTDSQHDRGKGSKEVL